MRPLAVFALLAGIGLLIACVLPGGLPVSARADENTHQAVDPHDTDAAPASAADAHDENAHHADSHEEAHHEEHPELPNLIHLLYKALGGPAGEAPAWLETLHRFGDLVYALLVAGLIILIVRLGTRKMTWVPRGAQNVVEAFIGGFHNFISGILGPEEARRYVPFLGTLFLYIWWMNLFGLVPLMRSPTAALSTTGALALCVFLYVQSIGIRRLGPAKYFAHLAGDPQDLVGWLLVPLMLPLHIIGECAKPVSLSLRLFGNILGEDVLIGVFAGLGVALLAFMKLPIGIPLHLPFILLALLMSTVQALVFTLLSTIYILQVLPHGHDEEGHGQSADARETSGGH
jgi:F-type H+-transporting ATPase subunit a